MEHQHIVLLFSKLVDNNKQISSMTNEVCYYYFIGDFDIINYENNCR